MTLVGALLLWASRFASRARATTSISSANLPITSPKIQISLSEYRPAISKSVACHKARSRLSADPLTMASSSSWRIDVASGIAKTPIIPRENYFSTATPYRLSPVGTYKTSIVKNFMGTSLAFGCDCYRSLTAPWLDPVEIKRRFDAYEIAMRRCLGTRRASAPYVAGVAGHTSRVERAVTYVGSEIIEKLATILEVVGPAELFRRPNRSGSRRKAD